MPYIKKKNKLQRFFCKHDYQEGVLSGPNKPMFHCIGGETYTTICIRCGKIKGTRFAEYAGNGFK